MLIEDIIKNNEKKLINHYRKNGSPKVGYTMIHTIKQKVDYAVKPDEDWNKTYLKMLSDAVSDHGIKV